MNGRSTVKVISGHHCDAAPGILVPVYTAARAPCSLTSMCVPCMMPLMASAPSHIPEKSACVGSNASVMPNDCRMLTTVLALMVLSIRTGAMLLLR